MWQHGHGHGHGMGMAMPMGMAMEWARAWLQTADTVKVKVRTRLTKKNYFSRMTGLVSNSGPPNFRSINLGLGLRSVRVSKTKPKVRVGLWQD